MKDGACRDKSGFVSRNWSAGFTLIELLIVLVFISILSSVGIGYYFNYYRQTLLKSAAETMSSFVYIIQQKAIGQEETSQWGVHFENPLGAEKPFYASFKGAAYATPIEKVFLDNALDFEYPADGTSVDIVFSKISGKPSPAEYKKVYLKLATGESVKALRVSPLGVISLDDGEVGWWKLEEGSGSTAIDSSVFRQSGTLNNTTWLSGSANCQVDSSCASFNGSSSYIEVPDSTVFDINQMGFTYSAWIKPSGFTQSYNMFMGHFLPYFNVLSNRKLHMSMSAAGAQRSVYGNTLLDAGTWYFAAATYDSSGYMRVYLNGREDGIAGPFIGPGNYNYNFYIGKWQSGSSYLFAGAIDDVRVYDRALSGVEIERIYQLTK